MTKEEQIKLDFGKLKQMLEWQVKCDGRHPLLHVREDDQQTQDFLTIETNRWRGRDDDAYVPPAAIEVFIHQFIDCLSNIESRDRITIMKRIQTLGGYGYNGGSITGRNEYSKDKSRVDGSIFQRARR